MKHKSFYTYIIILSALLIAAVFVLSGVIEKRMDKILYPLKFSEYVETYAKENNIDKYLVYSVIHTESGFEPNAVSSANARGLMQITEETFNWIKSKIAADEQISYDDMFKPDVNIRFGTYYIAACLERYGDADTAIAAYHSGWGTVDKLLTAPEHSRDGIMLDAFPYTNMRQYVAKVNKAYGKYMSLYIEK